MKRKGSLCSCLKSKKGAFSELELHEQCQVLQNLISYFATSTQNIDLSLLGAGEHVGTMKLSKHIDKQEECMLINRSVTGLFENEVDLLSL